MMLTSILFIYKFYLIILLLKMIEIACFHIKGGGGSKIRVSFHRIKTESVTSIVMNVLSFEYISAG